MINTMSYRGGVDVGTTLVNSKKFFKKNILFFIYKFFIYKFAYIKFFTYLCTL